jgi:IS4 transposase
VFCWAKYQRTKGAVKLHLLLDHDGYLPTVAVITEGKVADVRVARQLRFEPGTILIMDRGYVDFAWFDRLTAQGVFFVTRPKTGMADEVVEHRKIDVNRNLLSDQIIELTSETGQKVTWQLRRIEIWVPEKEERMALLTNHLDLSALTIAAIYKERWQVELFFKALKQNLKIKTFVGTTANALRIQIWTALIAMLLLRYLQLRSTFGWSLSNLAALLRMNLFVHRDLWAWINQPFEKPPQIPEPVQAHLALA